MVDTPSNLDTSTGLGCTSTSLILVTFTTPAGLVDTTASFISPIRPPKLVFPPKNSSNIESMACGCLTPVLMMSPLVNTLPLKAPLMSPRIITCWSTGARTTFWASLTLARLTVTSSPIDVPAFFLI